jgi:predicted phosphoribosyltransferase
MFRNRSEAGRLLAHLLEHYRERPNTLVLALPRGGVPVGYEVASFLKAAFDVFLVRKLGVPGQEELAMGAIASGGIRILNESVIRHLNIPAEAIELATEHEHRELERREWLYRGNRPAPEVSNRIVILVDDGLATGSSMRVAVSALRQRKPEKIIVAVPVAPEDTCNELRAVADQVVCATTPVPFYAVGQAYSDFEPISDAEVQDLLRRAA